MQVVLRTSVAGLGRPGDVIDVARGYAQNYLLPSGQAMAATPGVQLQAKAMRRAHDLRDARDREAAEAVASVVAGRTITVTARAGAEGKLFGSITVADLTEALVAQTGAHLDRKQIHLKEPIKSLGTHSVPVHLHGDVRTEVLVEVVPT